MSEYKVPCIDSYKLGYYAGFIDGEGCFTSNIPGYYPTPVFSITQRVDCADVLYEFKDIFGGYISYTSYSTSPNGNPCYVYRISSKKHLKKFLPFLESAYFVLKRKQAKAFIKHINLWLNYNKRDPNQSREKFIENMFLCRKEITEYKQYKEVL